MAAFKPRRPRNGTSQTPRPFRRNKVMASDPVPSESRRAARQRFLKTRGIYLLPNAFTTAALFAASSRSCRR
jgi:CDP-diacylglycerol--serine O-phosphatidyltransferase